MPLFPNGSPVHRLLRPIVLGFVSLGLAVGAGIGLAAPAQADNALTGGIISPSPVILDDVSTTLTFGGTKDATSTITQFEINNPAPATVAAATNCTVTPDGTGWTCSYTATFNGADGNTIEVDYTNSDGTPSQTLITFDVKDDPETSPAPVPYVVPTTTFSPGAVTVTPTPSIAAGADLGETQLYVFNGEDWTAQDLGCPYVPDGGVATADPEPPTCTFELDPHIWLAESQQGSDATDNAGTYTVGNPVDSVFEVLDPPQIDSADLDADPPIVKNGDGTVTIEGLVSGNPTANVVVFDQSGAKVCSDAIPYTDNPGDFSSWSCTTGVLAPGTHVFMAATQDQGTARFAADDFGYYYLNGSLSTLTTMGTVLVTAPAAPSGGTASGDTTPNWSFSIGGDLTDIHPGDTITVTGSGLPAGTTLDTVLHSVPTDLGSVVAAADGTFTQTVTIPTDTELGPHTIQLTATRSGLVTTTKQQAITVTAAPPAASGSSGKSTVVAPAPIASHGSTGQGTGIAPNILTRALTPIADVAIHPNKILSAIEIGLVLLLLAVLPAHLLNATIAEQSDRFERRFGAIKTPKWLSRLGSWLRSAPVVGGVIVTLATAILFGFADPKFGFTLASLRLILACGIALFLVGYVANALTGVIARTQWNIVAAVSARPYGLILTIIGVVVSRVLHFSPGFLIGLILGLTIQGKSAAGFAWRTVVTRTSIVLIMAIAAWIGYSTLTLGGNEGGNFGSELLVETLVAITTEGVVALLVELLPLRFLEGERVYAHSRVLWGILYVLTVVVFVLAVVPWEGNWDALGSSLWIWIVVLAAFALICVGVYVYFRRFAPPLVEEAGNENVALGETVSGDHS